MNISYFDQGTTKKLVHTVNGTAMAVPRIIMAILENYWNEEKQIVEMPEVLKPYLPFEYIGKKRQSVMLTGKVTKE